LKVLQYIDNEKNTNLYLVNISATVPALKLIPLFLPNSGIIFSLLISQTGEENNTRYLMKIFMKIVDAMRKIFKFDCMELIK
jgi:hypothetical protein